MYSLVTLILIILIHSSFASNPHCEYCTQNRIYSNINYGCGSIFDGMQYWNAVWYQCAWNPHGGSWACPCMNLYHNMINYKKTDNGVLYSNYVQTALFRNDTYVIGPIVHSSKLKVNDTIFWPTTQFKHEVLIVEHHDVTYNRDNCCWSIQIGLPACEVKYCCGKGCCC